MKNTVGQGQFQHFLKHLNISPSHGEVATGLALLCAKGRGVMGLRKLFLLPLDRI